MLLMETVCFPFYFVGMNMMMMKWVHPFKLCVYVLYMEKRKLGEFYCCFYYSLYCGQ